ncbi:hypothetical protein C8T65DRAFT_667596 [Cerioporus squamosus]|nr:hypothetical protein C8T65DRAFT_667596 [Cerioporus squamosus]
MVMTTTIVGWSHAEIWPIATAIGRPPGQPPPFCQHYASCQFLSESYDSVLRFLS